MDLNFVPTTRRPFSMEVGYFDTIQEIKEKIQKYHKIPVEKQTLIFNNLVLQDHLNIHPTEIIDKSHIQLIISEDRESTPPPENPITVIVKQESTPPPENPTTVIVNQESTPPPENATTVIVKQESTPPPENPTNVIVNQESSRSPETSTATKKITLVLKMLPTAITGMKIELEVNKTVWRLKEKINELDSGLPFWKLALRSNGVELHDHDTLHECGLLNYSEIEISIKRSAPPTGSFNAITKNHNDKNTRNPKPPNNNHSKNKNPGKPNNPNKLKIRVLPFKEKKKVLVEVNANDNVEELRKELDKVKEREQLNLGKEGFIFIHKQEVMLEDRSFQWHNVRQGDTIKIINSKSSS